MVSYWLLSGVNFCLVLSALLLLFKRSDQRFTRSLLGMVFLILSWYVLIILLIFSGQILRYPSFFRVGTPFYYLIPPLAYIYVRSRFHNEHTFGKRDWIHFLPFILALADVFPYLFLTSPEQKHAEMLQYLKHPIAIVDMGRGIIPPRLHCYLRILQGVVYLLFQLVLLRRERKRTGMYRLYADTVILTALLGLLYAGSAIMTTAILFFSGWFGRDGGALVYHYQMVFITIVAVMTAFWVFNNINFSPEAPQVTPEDDEGGPACSDHKTEEEKHRLPLWTLEVFVPRLESFMNSSEIFRKKGVTIYEIAVELEVSPHTLSAVLNNHYRQRFNDYINNYRINYVTGRLQRDKDWRKLSIEGLAGEAGFSSRTPFYTAFKKVTGTTPSAYIRQLDQADV